MNTQSPAHTLNNCNIPLCRIDKRIYKQLLNAIYDTINREAFNNELPKIPVKLVNLDNLCADADGAFYVKTKVYWHFLSNDRSSTYKVEYPTICIDSKNAYFRGVNGFFQIIDLMFHEMIHEYCYMQGIDDCDPKTQYHNFAFLQAAEKHGMHCIEYSTEYGFAKVSTSDELFKLIVAHIPEKIFLLAAENIKCVAA